MLADLVVARLEASQAVERVEGALELQALVEAGALPSAGRSAFVVPLGFNGGAVGMASGAYVQALTEVVGVVLAVRSSQPPARAARHALSGLVEAVVAALAGWQPPGAIDVLRLNRGFLVDVRKGIALYQLDFSISSQLRVLP